MHRPVRWTRSDNKGFFRRCWQGSHKHVLIRLEKRPSTRHSNILCNLFVKFTELTMIILIPPDWRYNVILVWSWNNVIASIKVQLQCKLIRLGSKSQRQPLGGKKGRKQFCFSFVYFSSKKSLLFSSKWFLLWFFATREFASGWMNPGLTALSKGDLCSASVCSQWWCRWWWCW